MSPKYSCLLVTLMSILALTFAVGLPACGGDSTGKDCIDQDQDLYGEGTDCLGADCNDTEPQINPGVAETCDGIDNDCDDLTDEDFDFQGDPDTCGGCSTQCTNPHGAVGCTSGACVPSCDQNYGDCDGDPINGCETLLSDQPTCIPCSSDTECPSDYFCNGSNCVQKREPPSNCTRNQECRSGICTDENICCADPCDGACRSCESGSCVAVQNGGPPDPQNGCGGMLCADGGECYQSCTSHDICISDFFCELTATDTSYQQCLPDQDLGGNCLDEGIPACLSGFCVDDVCCENACETICYSCFTGSCFQVVGADDVPDCTGDNTCDINGDCRKKVGIPCTDSTECASSFCIDWSCCDSVCDGICYTCSSGACSTVSGADDDPECTGINTCDLAGDCKLKNGQACGSGADCASGFCKDSSCCDTACDAPCQSCMTGACSTVSGADDDPECTGIRTCDLAGDCKLKNGQACGSSADCASGFCKDSSCCDTACDAPCQSCMTGACSTVSGADDDPECTGIRTCDLAGDCRLKNGQACGSSTDCASGFCKDSSCCDTACDAPCQSCMTGACSTVSGADDNPECTGISTCDLAGDCKLKNGQACGSGTDCASGFCKDSVCCNTACDAPCQSCMTGACSTVSGADDIPECTGISTCDLAGACKLKNGQACGSGADCASGFCKDSVCCDTACDAPCQNCAGGACSAVSGADDIPECTGISTCDLAGACKLKNGQACGSGTDCASGFCKDSVCCNTACNAPCQNCAGGACSLVAGADDNPECTGNSTCDLAGACRLKNGQACGSGTDCASGFCKDSVCCNTACNAPCQNCATGACIPVTNGNDVPECTGCYTCNALGNCVPVTDCDTFNRANSTTVTGWTEQVGDWWVFNNTLRSQALATWQWITRNGTNTTNGCIKARAIYGAGASVRFLGLAARYSNSSTYIMAKIQDNTGAGNWNSYFIYDNTGSISSQSGLSLGTDAFIQMEFVGTAVTFRVDANRDGTWENQWSTTVSNTSAGPVGAAGYQEAFMDDWCWACDCTSLP